MPWRPHTEEKETEVRSRWLSGDSSGELGTVKGTGCTLTVRHEDQLRETYCRAGEMPQEIKTEQARQPEIHLQSPRWKETHMHIPNTHTLQKHMFTLQNKLQPTENPMCGFG